MAARTTLFLNKLFNIRPGEWPRLLILYTMYFIALTGINWGEPVVEASFLAQIGVEFLPYAFVINAAFSILSLAVYTVFADRINNTTLLLVILGLSGGGIIIALAIIGSKQTVIAYPLLYFILNVPLLDIFNVHWATYINGFYDTQSAKRVVPVLGSAARISGIIAGLTLPLLNRYLPHTGIIIIWLVTLAMMGLLAWLMPRLRWTQPPAAPLSLTDSSLKTGYRQNLSDGFRYVSQSSFLRWLALSTLAAFILFPLLNYQALQIMQTRLQTVERIANFIALLNGVGNLLALPIQLFLLNRLIGRLGLGNTSLIFPTGTLAISGALIFWQNLPAAALAYFNRTTFRTTFRNPVDNLLYNAVPLRVKGRTRAFISGLIVPIGSLIGGLLLLLPFVPTSWLLPALIISLAILFPIGAFITRRQYTQALITMLEQEDFSFILSRDATPMIAADPATLKLLKQKLQQSNNDDLSIFMAQLISRIGGKEAISILGEAARQTNSPRLRAAFIETLTAAGAGDHAARQLYTEFLTDPDSHVRQTALVGLEQLAGTGDEHFTTAALTLLSDPEPAVQHQALAALARSEALLSQPAAIRQLQQMLTATDASRRANGVRILGQTGSFLPAPNLLDFLADPADEVRLAAILSIEQIVGRRQTTVLPDSALPKITPLLHDSVEPVRQTALNILARLGSHNSYKAITGTLTDPSLIVRNTAVEAMVRVGKPIIPIIHPQLDSATPQQRKMAAVILGRINSREFGDLIKPHLTNNLLQIYKNHGLSAALADYRTHRSIGVLQNVLQEQNDTLLDEIFYLLTAIHAPDDVWLIQDSLQSENSRIRANASEALEAITTPQTAQLIAPLLAPDTLPDALLKISDNTWEMQHPTPAQAVHHLCSQSDAPWLRAMMVFALGEIGAAQAAAPPPPPPKPAPPPPDPLAALTGRAKTPPPKRRPPADPLSKLINDEPPASLLLPQAEIKTILHNAAADPVQDVRRAAQAAQRIVDGKNLIAMMTSKVRQPRQKEAPVLSAIEKIIFLKEVPFFQGMTINQLQTLANICEENLFEADQTIFSQGDAGGALYVIVSGRVGIEQEKRAGSFARLATLEARSYFGEMSLFDNSARSAAAVALQDTLILRIRREPLIALARQHPDLSLELIQVLSDRLRQANKRIAELTRTHPRQLQKLYDALE